MNRAIFGLSGLILIVAGGCQGPSGVAATSDTTAGAAKLSPEICQADFQAEVEYIASDECAGRLTGSPGAMRAANYIAAVFKHAGLQPISATDGYFQTFEFAAGVQIVPDRNKMEILDVIAAEGVESGPKHGAKGQACVLGEDFRPLAFSASGAAEGEIVFAGYGLVEPQSAGKGYDSYAGLDVKDKIVLAMRGLPENASPQRRQELSLYATDRYKAKLAAERGAKGFMVVIGPNSVNAGELAKLREDDRESSGPIVAVSISGELTSRLLGKAGLNIKVLQTMQDGDEPNPHAPMAAPGIRVRIAVELQRLRKTCRNVMGVLPPADGVDEYVVVGAHYDHIGAGVGLGSLAHRGEEGQIHNGADDNASGVSEVLELAAAMGARRGSRTRDKAREGTPAAEGARTDSRISEQPRRGVVFACWSGEELGLIGSTHFVSQPVVPLEKVVAYVNFDMVGRLRENKLIVQAAGSSPAWKELLDGCKAAEHFSVTYQEDPYLPSDSTAFYTKGVPVLAFFTGSHEDYNRPTDDAATLNYDGLERIGSLAKCLIDEAVKPARKIPYARVQRAAPAGPRGGARAYTGTVPDFAGGDVKGVRIADVRPGGPAEKAGLKPGDVIVEFAGSKITNLQDYSDALIGVKIGQEVPLVVDRAGQRIELKITPTVRPE